MSRTLQRLLALCAAALLLPAALADASGTVATTPTTPTPPPKPARGSLRLYLPDAFFVNHQAVSVPNRRLHVNGIAHPFVPGQWVTVREFLGARMIRTDRVRLKPSRRRTFGWFSIVVSSPKVGYMTVVATHSRTSVLTGFRARRGFSALDRQIGFGSIGRFVELVQQRLAALHFYIPRTGVYDQGTGLAIDAYHRLLGWGTYQTLDGSTISYLLNGWGSFKVHYPRHGTHAEGDLTHQLLALVNGSQVAALYPISSGKPSTPTVLGNFQVYRRVPGYLPDGMYYSSFFTGGYAIHGYDPAPDYPASHGCMRLPIVDAISVFHWLNFGDDVDVYL